VEFRIKKEEQYTKLLDVKTYQEKIINKYDDNKITKEEYNTIIKEINTQFNEVVNDYNYLISKKRISEKQEVYKYSCDCFGNEYHFVDCCPCDY
jgi:hypothetical protein